MASMELRLEQLRTVDNMLFFALAKRCQAHPVVIVNTTVTGADGYIHIVPGIYINFCLSSPYHRHLLMIPDTDLDLTGQSKYSSEE